MNFLLKITAGLFLMAFTGSLLHAQDNMIFLGRNTPQKYLVNPAMFPGNTRFFISCPVLGGITEHFTGNVSYSDVVSLTSDKKARINSAHLLASLKDENQVRNVLNLDIVNVGFRIARGSYMGISVRARTAVDARFTKDIVSFIMDNPIGKNRIFELDLSPDALGWGEVGISFTQRITRNFNAGLRINGLMGVVSAQAEKMHITADKRFDKYILTGGFDVRTGNLNLGDNEEDTFEFSSLDNPGFSIDMGVAYLSDNRRLQIHASVSDLGKIWWSDKMSTRIMSGNPDAKYEWIGVKNLDELTSGNRSFKDLLDDVVDEMTGCMEMDTLRAAFTSSLPFTVQAGSSYAVDRRLRHKLSGNLLWTVPQYAKSYYEFTAGYTYSTLSRRWDLIAAYTYKSTHAFNIGIGGLYRGRGFEIFLITDSINSYFSYKHARSAMLRFGMNFYCGK